MYAACSEQYWKRKTAKPFSFNTSIFVVLLLVSSIIIGVTVKKSSGFLSKREEHRILTGFENTSRPVATKENFHQCEVAARDFLRVECEELCKGESMSIPRPVMFRSCQDGCLRSFYTAAIVGCHEGTEDEAFRKTNIQSHLACSTYDNVDPRPNVQSTCKKYYRLGTKRGWQLGFDLIQKILDGKLIEEKNNL